ncbi:MAG: M48 family peptidase, partial [Pseudomonadota bacterium]
VHEMKGEILLRSNRPKEAVAPFRKAIALDRTKAGFIQIELGHALLEAGGKANAAEAAKVLSLGVQKDPTALSGFSYLARARAMSGDEAGALLASAELAFRTGNKPAAKNYAKRAQQSFKRGSPRWLRAQDIIELK